MTFQSRTLRTSYASQPFTKVNAEPRGKSAPICDLTLAKLQRGLPVAVLPFGDAAAEMVNATFGGQSRRQTAINAAQALGGHKDTWERVLANETGRIDSTLLFACLHAYQTKFKRPFPIGGGLGVAIVTTGGAQ